MAKKPKKQHPHYVKPEHRIGDTVTKNGELYIVESIRCLNSGNRPFYTLVGLLGIWPEPHIKKMEDN